MTETPAVIQPWRGSVNLRFEPAADGATQWQGGARSPLKLLRHFTAGDGRCVMPLLHTAGGLVGGDQLDIALHAATGRRWRVPRWLVTRFLYPVVVRRWIYGGTRR